MPAYATQSAPKQAQGNPQQRQKFIGLLGKSLWLGQNRHNTAITLPLQETYRDGVCRASVRQETPLQLYKL